jgi:N6-adenosine-specific RNA methylase IME4
MDAPMTNAAADLLQFVGSSRFSTVLADPPWQFDNRTGKIAPEHRRLSRYSTMSFQEIEDFPISNVLTPTAHLYLWCPNALLPEGLAVLKAWGFIYKSNLVWHKVRKDGGSDGRGVGFYFRNVTELVLFGVRGKHARTLAPARSQVNLLATRKREHSRKPDEQYKLIEACSAADGRLHVGGACSHRGFPRRLTPQLCRSPFRSWRAWGRAPAQPFPCRSGSAS